jgi:hypothetical protein
MLKNKIRFIRYNLYRLKLTSRMRITFWRHPTALRQNIPSKSHCVAVVNCPHTNILYSSSIHSSLNKYLCTHTCVTHVCIYCLSNGRVVLRHDLSLACQNECMQKNLSFSQFSVPSFFLPRDVIN